MKKSCWLALNDDTEGLLSRALEVYSLLKEDFLSSIYLPLTAMVIAENAEPERYCEIAKRTRGLYKQMRSEHPFLTSGEDSALCALMALMDKTDSEMLQDSEECYRILRKQFRTSHSVQGLSNVLALFDGTPKEKCERTISFFEKLMQTTAVTGTLALVVAQQTAVCAAAASSAAAAASSSSH